MLKIVIRVVHAVVVLGQVESFVVDLGAAAVDVSPLLLVDVNTLVDVAVVVDVTLGLKVVVDDTPTPTVREMFVIIGLTPSPQVFLKSSKM